MPESDSAEALHKPSLDEQRDYWKFWQRTRSDSGLARIRADFVLQMLKDLDLDSPQILDFGCGTGWFTDELSQFGSATGADLNQEAMQAASARWPHVTFLGGDLFQMPLAANAYDVVVSMQVIAHVEDQAAYIRHAAQVLRPGGHLLLTTNNKFVMQHLGEMDWGSHRSLGHIENWLSQQDLRRLLTPHFEIHQMTTLIPMGNGGVLRIVNSHKVNALLGTLVSKQNLRRMKERMGLGYYIILAAQKPGDAAAHRC